MFATSYHIVRNGQPLGQFALDEIESKLQDGTLVLDDRVFLDTERKWVSLNEWRSHATEEEKEEEADATENTSSIPLPISTKDGKPLTVHTDFGTPRSPKSTDRKHSIKKLPERRHKLSGDDFIDDYGKLSPQESNYKKRRKKARFQRSLYGYIAAAIAILIAMACFYWGNGYRKREGALNKEIASLKAQTKLLAEQNRSLLLPVPAGQIAGAVGIEDLSNQFAPLAGATVTLYRRADIEKFIESHPQLNRPNVAKEELGNIITTFQIFMPRPVAATLTNSDGTFHFAVSDPGDYALFICANKTVEGEQVVWLQGVRTGSPSQRILLTDREAITAERFHFQITPPPGLTRW